MCDLLSDFEKLASENKFKEALDYFRKNKPSLEKSSQAWNILGFIYYNMGKADKAIEKFTYALKLDPNCSDALYNLDEIINKKKPDDPCFTNKDYLRQSFTDKKRRIIKENSLDKSCSNSNHPIVSIIIVTYNQLEFTKQCIISIRKYTPKETYELTVIDNGSTDGTLEWLGQQNDIKKIINKENLGFPMACNQGIKISGGKDILLLNNDTIVTKDWLTNLTRCLYSAIDIGAVGPVTNYCSNYQTISSTYNSLEEMHAFAKEYNLSDPLKWEQKIKLVGYCLLIKNEVVVKIGLLDEMFSPGNYEDDDYSMRIIQGGYRLMLCKDTFIHHFGSVSFKKDSEKFSKLLIINNKKFEDKWGFNPNYSFNTRNDIIDLMTKPKGREINLLEIGCACGATLLKANNIFSTANIFGIELNENAAKIASHFAEVKTGNIEEIALDYKDNFFDYIIIADVLEHLIDPWKILSYLSRFLKEDGEVLASIPNIMHYSVIKNLLNGRFQYTEAGILDKTHVRFFTFTEMREMFLSCGYENIEFRMVFLNTSPTDKEFIEGLCKFSDNSFLNQFQAYQYLVKASIKAGKTANHKTDVVIPVLDRREETEKTLDSLFENNNNINVNIIDNGSEDLAYLEKYNLNVIRNSKNNGAIKSLNQGLDIANSKYVVVMHNDVSVNTKNWIYKAINFMEENPHVGIVGTSGWTEISDSAPVWSSIVTGIKRYNYKFNSDFVEVLVTDGQCNVLRNIGVRYDEDYGMMHCYDIDICLEYRKRGYCSCVLKTDVEHFGEELNRGTRKHSKYVVEVKNDLKLYSENSVKFKNKWKDFLTIQLNLH